MPLRLRLLLCCTLGVISTRLEAQADSIPHNSRKWIAPAVVTTTSFVLDAEIREWGLREHSPAMDGAAKVFNRIGTGSVLIPAMAGMWTAAVVTHHGDLARGTLETAAAYAITNAAVSLLKPAIGRERPYVAGNSRRLRPFTSNGDWHSLPSAHVAHITSIVTAISAQTHSRGYAAIGDVLVGLVAFDRIYEDEHWTSDAALTIELSSLLSHSTIRWLERRWPRS